MPLKLGGGGKKNISAVVRREGKEKQGKGGEPNKCAGVGAWVGRRMRVNF